MERKKADELMEKKLREAEEDQQRLDAAKKEAMEKLQADIEAVKKEREKVAKQKRIAEAAYITRVEAEEKDLEETRTA